MLPRLFISIAEIGDPRVGGGDSHTDRLNCRYTVYILVIFAILVMTRQYAGDPIGCWCPAEFPKSQVEFTNQVCWVQSTYYVPYDEELPEHDQPKSWIGYYQWVGLLLCFQAVLFYVPRIVWRILNQKSGISVVTLTDAAATCSMKQDQEQISKHISYMVKHMSRFLTDTSRSLLMSGDCKSIYYLLYGNYLCGMYLILKMLYITNSVGQIFLLDRFLGTSYGVYGFEVLDKLRKGEGISESHRFPRVSMCDIDIRHLGTVNTYTVQCALPINLFNEKIFIFIWFWFVFITIATIGSFFIWTYIFLFIRHQEHYIKARLLALDRLGHEPDHMITSFIDLFLRRDGIFLIKMVAKNGSDLVAAELIAGLWDHFLGNKRSILRLNQRPDYADRVATLRGLPTFHEGGEGNVVDPDEDELDSDAGSIISKIHFSKMPTPYGSMADVRAVNC